MQLVKFKGTMALPSQTARHLDKATLERLGVDVPDSLLDDNGNLVFGPKNSHTVEMSNEASDSLVAALPNEFQIVESSESAEQLTMPLSDQNESLKPSRKRKQDETDADGETSDDD